MAAPTIDNAIPVLPLLHSRMIEWGDNNPRSSASVSTHFANRSLMLPLGFRNSHLAHSVIPSGSNRNETVGVLPINASTDFAREFMSSIEQKQRIGCGW